MHGAEERPSSAFAMVFQKAPLNIKSLRHKNAVKSSNNSVWSIGLSSGNKNTTVSSVPNDSPDPTTSVASDSTGTFVATSPSFSMVIFNDSV